MKDLILSKSQLATLKTYGNTIVRNEVGNQFSDAEIKEIILTKYKIKVGVERKEYIREDLNLMGNRIVVDKTIILHYEGDE